MTAQTRVHSIAIHQPATSTAEGGVGLRVAGGLFLGIGLAFITVTMLAASIAPGYDFGGGAISDLGTIPETALLFNALLVAMGLANVAGGYLLYRATGGLVLLALFATAGIGAIGAGLMPLDTGDAHALFALLAFLAFNLQSLAAARAVPAPLRWLGLVSGAIGLVYLGVMVVGDSGNPAVFGAIGHGGAERMIAYPAMLWMIAAGGYLLGAGADPAGRPSP